MPLPSDHHLYTPETQFTARFPDTFTADLTPPESAPSSRRGSSAQHTTARNTPAPAALSRTRSPAYAQGGPQYEHLTSHEEDMRRLIDECTAAKESARVLAEALIYTRPDELEQKPIIRVSRTPNPLFVWLMFRNSTKSASMRTSLSRIRWIGHKPRLLDRARELTAML